MHTFKEYADLVKKEHALNKTIAPNETGTTASKAYAVGDHFIRNGILYKVKTAIASGATWANISSSYTTEKDISSSIQNLSTVINKNGAKNLLPFSLSILKAINTAGTWNNNAYTHNGITYTVNEDNTVTVNGTNSTNSSASLYLAHRDRDYFITLKEGSYILSGCPSGGYSDTYNLYISDSTVWISDFGSGKEFTVSQDKNYSVNIVVSKNTTISNLTFKPMIRLASDTDPTYEPWAMTNRELTERTNALAPMLNELGAKNLWTETIEPTALSGVSYTLSNHVYTVSAPASSSSGVYWSTDKLRPFYANRAGVAAKISFEVKADAACSAYVGIGNNEVNLTTSYQKIEQDIADLSQIDAFKIYNRDTEAAHTISVKNIMICFASIADDTYAPFAMTNRELTQAVVPITGSFTYDGATFKYNKYPDYVVITSSGATTSRMTASEWTEISSAIPDLVSNVQYVGHMVLNNGDTLKINILATGIVRYLRAITGSGAGNYIQDSCYCYKM